MSDTPNVLFILADDQRFDTLAALGNPHIHTPNLDRLAREGTAFTRAHIPSGTVGAVCMPSRAMLHTGRTLFQIEGAGEEIPEAHMLMGECFRRAGYTTFGTGKWHNGAAAYARSFSDGAEIFFGGMDDHWNVPACRFDPTGAYDVSLPIVSDFFHSNQVLQRRADHVTPGKHSTDLFCDATLEFLDRTAEPFFAYVALMAPHDPRTMPEKYRRLYEADDLPLPPNFLHQHPYDTGALTGRDETLAAHPRQPEEIRRHLAEYYAMISHLDHAVGRLLDRLEAQGRRDNTIVVFTGDNGLAVGQHGLMGKQALYDHSVRVPLLISGPGVAAGQRRDPLCFLSDLYPTLCGLCHVPVPETVLGRDLGPCLADAQAPGHDSLYLAFGQTLRGVTNGRHKLIEYASGPTQLFDLEADPWELRNLAGDPTRDDLLATMRSELRRHHHASGEPAHPYGHKFWQDRPDLDGPAA